MAQEVLCIGSVLWDVIGRSPGHMALGADVPGRIVRVPGGVALNIAVGLRQAGLGARILTVVGRDMEGDALLEACERRGIATDSAYRSDDLPTDRYMAIEGANGLIAAIADAHSLERAGDKIFVPLIDGRLATPEAPFAGVAALDGNLTETLLAELATGPWLRAADLRVAPASPGKALRLLPLLQVARATIYVNRTEAELLLGLERGSAEAAARALADRSRARILVTDGDRPAAMAWGQRVVTATPPRVLVTRVTGAGDTFMAAHIAAEIGGAGPEAALEAGLAAAARHVAGDLAS